SVSSRNACSSPARARPSVCSITNASSHRLFPSSASRVLTSGRLETRRSVSVPADAEQAQAPTQNRRRRHMGGEPQRGKIAMSENVSLDGVVEDPAGDEGFARGGWVGLIAGREELAKVALDEALGAEALLLGRRTYEWLAARWPARTGELADRLNTMPKYVV